MVTYIPQPFMYRLYMFGEIILLSNIIFTLVTCIPQLFRREEDSDVDFWLAKLSIILCAPWLGGPSSR